MTKNTNSVQKAVLSTFLQPARMFGGFFVCFVFVFAFAFAFAPSRARQERSVYRTFLSLPYIPMPFLPFATRTEALAHSADVYL